MKADTYFQLNPMLEEAIKFAALHLEGVAHEWWHHDTITLGHDQINTYAEFIERLIDRFGGKDPELNFKDLAQLRQTELVDQYIAEFQKISVLVTNISERRQTVLFMDWLTELLKGWVKWFNLATLSEAIKKAQSMTSSLASSSRGYSHSKPSMFSMDKDNKPPLRKPLLDEATRQELRRKKICYNFKGPWELGHRCLGKGKINYIEVVSDDEDEHEDIPTEDSQPDEDTKMVSLNHMERIAALVFI